MNAETTVANVLQTDASGDIAMTGEKPAPPTYDLLYRVSPTIWARTGSNSDTAVLVKQAQRQGANRTWLVMDANQRPNPMTRFWDETKCGVPVERAAGIITIANGAVTQTGPVFTGQAFTAEEIAAVSAPPPPSPQSAIAPTDIALKTPEIFACRAPETTSPVVGYNYQPPVFARQNPITSASAGMPVPPFSRWRQMRACVQETPKEFAKNADASELGSQLRAHLGY